MIIGNKKNTKKKLLLIALFLAIVCSIGASVYWFYYRDSSARKTNVVDYSVRDKEDQRQATEKKEEIIRNEKEDPAVSQDINVVINRFLQIPSSAIQLRSTVSGTAQGECAATFALDEHKFTKTFPSEYTGTYWACNIDLLNSDFPSSGNWTVSLTITSQDGKSSDAANSEARIET